MITVYTTQTCVYCPMVKKYLTMKNVEFTVVDVTDSPEKALEIQKLTGLTTVPITTDGTEFVAGWNVQKLAELIRS